MSPAEKCSNQYVTSTREQWRSLVLVTRNTFPRHIPRTAQTIATAAGVASQGIKVKMLAISESMASGQTDEQIITAGQKKTVGAFLKKQAEEKAEAISRMSWMVSAELKYLVETEVFRIAQVLDLRTSEQFWMWLHSEMCLWTPQQLRHSAGEPKLKVKRDHTGS